jgi:hypothetical protein
VNRLVLPCPPGEWIEGALGYPGIRLLYLTPRIAVESTQLPGIFHRDPADQIVVATARIRNARSIIVCLTTDNDRRVLLRIRGRESPSTATAFALSSPLTNSTSNCLRHSCSVGLPNK